MQEKTEYEKLPVFTNYSDNLFVCFSENPSHWSTLQGLFKVLIFMLILPLVLSISHKLFDPKTIQFFLGIHHFSFILQITKQRKGLRS